MNEYINKIKAYVDAVPPGPWEIRTSEGWWISQGETENEIVNHVGWEHESHTEPVSTFIVSAIRDIPHLINIIEHQKELIDKFAGELSSANVQLALVSNRIWIFKEYNELRTKINVIQNVIGRITKEDEERIDKEYEFWAKNNSSWKEDTSHEPEYEDGAPTSDRSIELEDRNSDQDSR